MADLIERLRDGSKSAGDLVAELDVSRSGLKHLYEKAAGRVLRIGRARKTRYALRRPLPGLETDEFPVFRVDETGKIAASGTLMTLAATESVWLPDETVIDGLPAEMQDIAPSGFLGPSFARRNADLGLPEDVTRWSDHHVLIAISRRGEDLPGNLVIGRESFDRFQALHREDRTPREFRELSAAALAGEHAGSSAGGEQPKFAALVEGLHRLVKFATDESDNARRWQDLLLLEHTALETLRDAGIAAAATTLHDEPGLRCLVVDRFDRIGATGRRAVMSLSAAAGHAGGTWTDAAEELHRRGELSGEDKERLALLDAFGAQIANSDRHLSNVLLYPAGNRYELAPAYDQLPMAYSPAASGHFRHSAADPATPRANTLDVWDQARELAGRFWQRARELRLSPSMQSIVATHASR